MPKSIPTEKSQTDDSKDIRGESSSHGMSNVESSLDTNDSNSSALKILESASASTSASVDSNDIPCVPFSATFGKSEKLKGKMLEQLRLSLDSQTLIKRRASDGERHLRRRARSSEGFMLRNNRIEFFDDDSHFEASRKDEVLRRRKPENYISHQEKQLSEKNFYSEHQKGRSRSVIPIEHPFKIIWDVLTVILSIAHSYLTHMAIRDRRFEASPFISFCQAWFLVDILLNFFSERKTNTGEIISDHRRIVARYLTSWFAVDILSLIPWEVLYVQPLIDIQNRRGFFKKSFFRSKAVVRVTRHLRGKHFRWFGTVAKHTKHHGVGAQRLLRLIIKYVPKYIMFFRNMKGVVAVRILRFVHWSRRSFQNIESKPSDATNKSTNSSRGDICRSNTARDVGSDIWKKESFDIVNDWGKIDDDGVPL